MACGYGVGLASVQQTTGELRLVITKLLPGAEVWRRAMPTSIRTSLPEKSWKRCVVFRNYPQKIFFSAKIWGA